MFADQLAESTGNEAITTGVQFLAHEDTALKAYFQTRGRYLGGLPQRRAFNQIGEVLPCVIVDGRGGHLVMEYPDRQHRTLT